MATKTIKASNDPTRTFWCPSGHPVKVRVDRRGKIRGDGVLICPLCHSTELAERS